MENNLLRITIVGLVLISAIFLWQTFWPNNNICSKSSNNFQIFSYTLTGTNLERIENNISLNLYGQVSRYLGANVKSQTTNIITKTTSSSDAKNLSKSNTKITSSLNMKYSSEVNIETNNFVRKIHIYYKIKNAGSYYKIEGTACVSNLYLNEYINIQSSLLASKVFEDYEYYISAYNTLHRIDSEVRDIGIKTFLFKYQKLLTKANKFIDKYNRDVNLAYSYYDKGQYISAFSLLSKYFIYPQQTSNFKNLLSEIQSKLSNIKINLEAPDFIELYKNYTINVKFENLPSEHEKMQILISDSFGNKKYVTLYGDSTFFNWKVSMLSDNYTINVSIPGLQISTTVVIPLRVFAQGETNLFSVEGFKSHYDAHEEASFMININSSKINAYYIYLFYYKGAGDKLTLYDIISAPGTFTFDVGTLTQYNKEGMIFLLSLHNLNLNIGSNYCIENIRNKITNTEYQEIEKFYKVK